MAKVTRRTFLSTTVGAAGGVAAMGLIAGPSTLVEAAQNVADASDGPVSSEPMTAYVRDAGPAKSRSWSAIARSSPRTRSSSGVSSAHALTRRPQRRSQPHEGYTVFAS